MGRVAGSRQQEINVGVIHRQSFLAGRLTPKSGLCNLVSSWLALICGCLSRFTVSVRCGLLRRDLAVTHLLSASCHPGSWVCLPAPLSNQLNGERQVLSQGWKQAAGNLESGQRLVLLGDIWKEPRVGFGASSSCGEASPKSVGSSVNRERSDKPWLPC